MTKNEHCATKQLWTTLHRTFFTYRSLRWILNPGGQQPQPSRDVGPLGERDGDEIIVHDAGDMRMVMNRDHFRRVEHFNITGNIGNPNQYIWI